MGAELMDDPADVRALEDKADDLEAENGRLRAVIAKAADWADPDCDPSGMTGREMASTLRRFLATGVWSIGGRPHFQSPTDGGLS